MARINITKMISKTGRQELVHGGKYVGWGQEKWTRITW